MTTRTTRRLKTSHPYIVADPKICGGAPIIQGTRIRVTDIAIEHEQMGYSADEIIEAHPDLTLAQVYDALSYYCDHREELDQGIRQRRQEVESYQEYFESIGRAR